jgi:anaerobic glycerol-3-phosphate dehydrogenase
MHWLIMHADQVIGGVAQMTTNIKIQKTGAEVASYAEAVARFRSGALDALRCQNVAVAISNTFAGVAPGPPIQENRATCQYSRLLWRVCDQEGYPSRPSR